MNKYLKYLKYVLVHKYYVFIECFKVGLFWRGIMHDMSKFFPDEFLPYARYFYGEYPGHKDYKRMRDIGVYYSGKYEWEIAPSRR